MRAFLLEYALIVGNTKQTQHTHGKTQAVSSALIDEWDLSRNGPLDPVIGFVRMSKKVWWICPRGHSYEASPRHRIDGTGCPYCAGRKTLVGFNDLQSQFPEIASEWVQSKNAPLTPETVVYGSNRKVWWKCQRGHEYQSVVAMRTRQGTGCAVCGNKRVLTGFNDLASTHPELAKEWHNSRNGAETASEVMAGTGRLYWWICEKGHEFQASPNNRTSGVGTNCPYCANKKVLPGFNDLGTIRPDIAEQWDVEQNGDLTPQDLTTNSGVKVWWKCQLGHSYQTTPDARCGSKNAGCPYCSGKVVLTGFNDLRTKNPTLASEWDFERNAPLTPSDVTQFSSSKVWWKCSLGHSWSVSAANRANTGCPVCSNKKLLTGYNDMATTHPDLASEWHPTRNGQISPTEVFAGARRSFWWKCPQGHEWFASSFPRTLGVGCPECAISGFDAGKPGTLYLIANDILRSRKIGITNTYAVTDRLRGWERLGWKIIHTQMSENGRAVQIAEKEIFVWIREELRLPIHLGKEELGIQHGYTETFAADEIDDAQLIQRMIQFVDEANRL